MTPTMLSHAALCALALHLCFTTSSSASVALPAAASAALPAGPCLPEYESLYVVSTAQGALTYNLSALCSPTGYQVLVQSTLFLVKFNIGGDHPDACTPAFPAYSSRGAVLQFLLEPPPQQPNCTAPQCHDWDSGGALRCCDPTCLVLATDWLSFSLLDPASPPTSGFRIDYPPAPILSDDPFPCAPLPAPNGLTALRTVALEVACDPSAGPGLTGVSFTEVGQASCSYTIAARSALACPAVSPAATASATATATAAASPAASATPAAPPAAAAAAPYVSRLDRDAGLFLGGALFGVAVALGSVALSQRGACDCFRQPRASSERDALMA